jgi:hypothetical protein
MSFALEKQGDKRLLDIIDVAEARARIEDRPADFVLDVDEELDPGRGR